jgi:hypothetical protein
MAELKKLETRLFATVGESVGELGFRTKKWSFWRSIPGGSQALHLAYIRHQEDFDVTADIAVRFDDVQALLLEGGAITPAAARVTMSLGAELGNIRDGRPKRWTVREDGDVTAVAAQIVTTFMDIGLPYLETYSDRRTALDALAKDDRMSWLHSPIHSERALRALFLCVVLNDRARFEAVLEHKLEFLATRNDPDLVRVRAFADKIRERLSP